MTNVLNRRPASLVVLWALVVATIVHGGVAQARPRCLGHPVTKVGNSGNNTIAGTPGRDVILGGPGNDFIAGFGGNDLLCGGPGRDVMFPGQDADRLDGGTGTDTVSFNDRTIRSRIAANMRKNRARGAGLDTWKDIENIAGSKKNDTLIGSNADELMLGVDGNDHINGSGGRDLILGHKGDDRLVGGGGDDLVSFFFSSKGVKADLGAETARGEGRDSIKQFEGLEGSEVGSGDVLLGDSGEDFLFGIKGRDLMLGGGGADHLEGGGDNDDLAGQGGDDIVLGQRGADRLGAIPSIQDASEDGSDYLIAGAYRGPDGGDKAYGGKGKDLLLGGSANDLLNGGEDEDVVDYTEARTGVEITLPAGGDGSNGDDQFVSIEDVYGSNLDDSLVGDAERNFLFGFSGDDHIDGGGGADVLKGYRDNDEILGADGDDLLNGGDGTDDLDGGLGVDTCHKGETTFMCELPPPVLIGDGPAEWLRADSFRALVPGIGRNFLKSLLVETAQ